MTININNGKIMTTEEKDLLRKDLCARLPYEVEVYYSETVPISTLKTINSEKGTCIVYDHSQWYRHSKFHIEEIKPYLRSMSSMTEEEWEELNRIGHIVPLYDGCFGVDMRAYCKNSQPHYRRFSEFSTIEDWFNTHHFDYRGLIEKGLAIEAPEGMYK